jgi:hypothetical protein
MVAPTLPVLSVRFAQLDRENENPLSVRGSGEPSGFQQVKTAQKKTTIITNIIRGEEGREVDGKEQN